MNILEQSTLTIPPEWDGEADSIMVETPNEGLQTLTQFWKGLKNPSTLFSDNIILLVQMFDSRVKAFMKNIFLTEEIKHYSFRIEFQIRGKSILNS